MLAGNAALSRRTKDPLTINRVFDIDSFACRRRRRRLTFVIVTHVRAHTTAPRKRVESPNTRYYRFAVPSEKTVPPAYACVRVIVIGFLRCRRQTPLPETLLRR